jgi:hypothetical protein
LALETLNENSGDEDNENTDGFDDIWLNLSLAGIWTSSEGAEYYIQTGNGPNKG